MAAEEKDPAVLIAQIEDCTGELIVTFAEKGPVSLDICSKGKCNGSFMLNFVLFTKFIFRRICVEYSRRGS